MKTIETQGRDGSPQPSQVSGATRRHPRRLRLKNRASRRSAPTISPLRASAPPHELSLRSRSAFTLLEVLVATAILALMMTFLFNLLGSSAKLWEIGNKKIEAAQAARVGLNIMADDLKNAFAGNMTSYTTNGTAIYNISPFKAFGNSTTTAMGLEDSVCKGINADGSQQIAGVTLTNNSSISFNAFGFMAVFVDKLDGAYGMIGDRYYLVKKLDSISGNGSGGQFYFRNSQPDTSWYENSTKKTEFYPIVDNCIRLKLEYYGNQTSATGTPGWTTPTGSWSPTDRLPRGVLITISVIDSKTAVKVNALKAGSALSAQEISNGLSSSPSATLTPVERLISQGSVTMSRFIPFNSN